MCVGLSARHGPGGRQECMLGSDANQASWEVPGDVGDQCPFDQFA